MVGDQSTLIEFLFAIQESISELTQSIECLEEKKELEKSKTFENCQ